MVGWIRQWYGKLPDETNDSVADEPPEIVPSSKKPSSEVAVCAVMEVLSNVTVPPFCTTSEDGVNEKFAMDTIWLPALAGVVPTADSSTITTMSRRIVPSSMVR
jgi:hypothetical protein